MGSMQVGKELGPNKFGKLIPGIVQYITEHCLHYRSKVANPYEFAS